MDLQTQRQVIADEIYQAFDFKATVSDADGWETVSPGKSMSRIVYLENQDDNALPTERAVFNVVFSSEDSAQVVEVYTLLTTNGALLGELMVFKCDA